MLQDMKYLKPKALNEALELLENYAKANVANDGKGAKILAGGTDLIIALQERRVKCEGLIDIKAIPELSQIIYTEKDGLSIGAAVCLNDIITSEPINKHYPILVQAAKTLANSLLRNRATLIGNLCNASPGGDMLPASYVLGGSLEIASKQGVRSILLRDFITGVKKTVLKENEIVTKIVFPNTKGHGKYLRKARIKGHDLAQVGVAAYLLDSGGLRIAIGAAGPTPISIDGFESIKRQDISKNKQIIINKVLSEIKPIGDQRASKEYRIAMASYFTGLILDELAEGV